MIDPEKEALSLFYDYQKEISTRFPINIKKLSFFLTKNFDSPISEIKGESLSIFTAGLFPLKNKKSWVIIYNKNHPPSKTNFSIAHELGHYFLHRDKASEFKCTLSDTEFLSNNYLKQEAEADKFASSLLIPRYDFFYFLKGKKLSCSFFEQASVRYGVSLTSVLLKWIELTFLDAVLLLEKNNVLLWSRSSSSTYAKGVYFKSGDIIKKIKENLLDRNYKESLVFAKSSSNIIMKVFYKKNKI